MSSRINPTSYYLTVVDAVRARSTCDRGRAGAIIVNEGRIVATGYAGSAAGEPHCDDAGHDIVNRSDSDGDSAHCVRTIHAEMNAIIQAARYGPSIDRCTMYCSMFPCIECAKAIVNAGITEVVARDDYQRSKRSKELFTRQGIRWRIEMTLESNRDELS